MNKADSRPLLGSEAEWPLDPEQRDVTPQRVICGAPHRPCCLLQSPRSWTSGAWLPPVPPCPRLCACPPWASGRLSLSTAPAPFHLRAFAHEFFPPKLSFPPFPIGILPILQGAAQIPLHSRNFSDAWPSEEMIQEGIKSISFHLRKSGPGL